VGTNLTSALPILGQLGLRQANRRSSKTKKRAQEKRVWDAPKGQEDCAEDESTQRSTNQVISVGQTRCFAFINPALSHSLNRQRESSANQAAKQNHEATAQNCNYGGWQLREAKY
jgi:hypothetical protein